jgi:hypothetical protein
MPTTPYIYDGAILGAALASQGTVVPTATSRIIKSASLVNPTAAPVVCSVSVLDAGGASHPKISGRAIAAGETYFCPELVGKGINAGGVVQAMGAGVSFDYTATDIV